MNTAVEESNTVIDPEAEVKKLQDLVKKLERQNQILRTQNPSPVNLKNRNDSTVISSNMSKPDSDYKPNSDNFVQKEKTFESLESRILPESLKHVTLEDIEVLDIEKVVKDEEEDSWLYRSPRKPSPLQKSISPYKWLRAEFEHPSPEIESAKKSLLYKLDEVSKVVRSPSSGTLGSLSSPSSTPTTVIQREPLSSTSSSNNGMPIIRQPLLGLGSGSRIDSSTFTRPKKNRPETYVTAETNNVSSPPNSSRASPEQDISHTPPSTSRTIRQISNGGDSMDGADDVDSPPLEDVVDVQVLARMQEESLRQSLSSPFISPKKSMSRVLNKSGPVPNHYDNSDNNSSPYSSNRSSPGRYLESDLYKSSRRSSNSLASASSHSSSPPGSPYGSQYLDYKPQDTHRRSMPNLARGMQMSLTSHPSESRLMTKESPPRTILASQQRRKSSQGRLPAPRMLSPARTLSPQRSGIPAPRSTGIPRRGSVSKLPTPRKSGIPPPRRTISPRLQIDDSWKDGCY